MKVNEKSTIFKAAGIVGIFSLLSRLAGLYRDHLFAGKFGAGDLLDSYYAAFHIPDLAYNLLILGTLSVSFIPIFTEYFIKDKERAQKIGNTVLTLSFVAMSALCLLLFAFVPQLTRAIVPGFHGVKLQNTMLLTRIFLLSPIIFTLSAVFGSVLNSLKRFLLASIAPIIYNFGIIAGILWFYPRFGIRGLAYGVILGAVAHLITQMIGALAAGFKIRPAWDIKDPAVRKVGKLFFWRIFSVDNSQVSLLIGAIIGSTLLSGTIAVFNLANNLQAAVIGMFGLSFATAAFPNLSEHFAKEEHGDFNHVLGRTIAHILFFVVPVSVLFILLRAQIVRVILGSGNFDWQATRLTANSLGLFAASIFAQSVAPLLSRAFFAMHNTFVPVVIGLLSVALNAALAVIFGHKFGVLGLSAAFSLANILNLAMLWFALRPRLRDFDGRVLARDSLKIFAATVGLVAATYLALHIYASFIVLDTTLKVFGQGLIAGIIGLAAFGGCAYLLGLSQVRTALSFVKARIFG